MTLISASQMRKIYALARERGMDNDLLHSVVKSVSGKASMKELTVEEGTDVIRELSAERLPGDNNPMTKKQFAYITMLMKDLGWMTKDGHRDFARLNGFLRKRYGIDHYKWLTLQMASKVIEGLKNMVSNMEEKS